MKVSPSLLAANFADLKPQLQMINESEADYLHLDVMDGVFVPNISFGFPVLKSVSEVVTKPLDVHLMIVEPQKWVSQVRDLGAEIMNVHQEACVHLDRCIHNIHQAGMKAGVTLCPSTPVEMLRDVIHEVDLVLIMTVNPGFGGQEFIMHSLDKIRRLRALIDETGSKAMIEADAASTAIQPRCWPKPAPTSWSAAPTYSRLPTPRPASATSAPCKAHSGYARCGNIST